MVDMWLAERRDRKNEQRLSGFRVILLVLGLFVYVYVDTSGDYSADQSNTLGLILVIAGLVFAALGFFHTPKRVASNTEQ
jgi:hypothetical protein